MKKSIHILLVEDNEGYVLITKEAFENTAVDAKLSVVRDWQETINFLTKDGIYSNVRLPDFLMLDINLPKRNGIEVLKYVKENENLKHIPDIMLSTSCAENDVISCYQNSANCNAIKPVNIDNFFEVISYINNFWGSIVKLPGKINCLS